MGKKVITPRGDDLPNKLLKAIQRFLSEIPGTDEPTNADPDRRARSIAGAAALKAAMVSGSLAIPPGPAGLITIIPDLITIWKIQAQMVADIAGAYGKQAYLSREQMLYCLFRHAAAQVVRDLVTRVGQRFLVKRAALHVIQRVIKALIPRITQRVIGQAVSRWVPVAGVLGVAAYAYYDTGEVGKTAIKLFSKEIEVNSWQETLYLLSNPANAEHLRQSIAEAQAGRKMERELIEP